MVFVHYIYTYLVAQTVIQQESAFVIVIYFEVLMDIWKIHLKKGIESIFPVYNTINLLVRIPHVVSYHGKDVPMTHPCPLRIRTTSYEVSKPVAHYYVDWKETLWGWSLLLLVCIWKWFVKISNDRDVLLHDISS